MPNPLNMPVILTGTPFAGQAHQEVVQQGELGVRDGLRRVEKLVEQEDSEVQELLPTDNPAVEEKGEGNPRRRRRKKPGEEEEPEEEVQEPLAAAPAEEGKGEVIDIEV